MDLANSEALRASRRVDPRGTRTIGVVTKMDLVDGELGAHILKNNNYPLKLGYVGVVCKSPNSSGVSSSSSSSLIPYSWRSPASSVEAAYFKSYPVYQEKKAMVGTSTLRLQLMQVLESHMKKSLSSIHRAVQSELEDARYQLKVEYNDRRISAESYISDTMDLLKARFKDYSATFTKPQIRQQIKALLEDKIVEICKGMYWSDLDRVTMLPRTCKVGGGGGSGSSTNAGGSSSPSSTFGGSGDASSDFWSRKLDVASSSVSGFHVPSHSLNPFS